jgi:hypothetical protein
VGVNVGTRVGVLVGVEDGVGVVVAVGEGMGVPVGENGAKRGRVQADNIKLNTNKERSTLFIEKTIPG